MDVIEDCSTEATGQLTAPHGSRPPRKEGSGTKRMNRCSIKLVRRSRSLGKDASIYRPPITMGDSLAEEIPSFNYVIEAAELERGGHRRPTDDKARREISIVQDEEQSLHRFRRTWQDDRTGEGSSARR